MSFANHSMLVDIVSPENETIGVSVRSQLLGNCSNFRTSHVLVVRRSGSIALQKLRSDHDRSPSKLGSSVAGYLRAGENYAQAARRKMNDELRINENPRYIGTLEMRDENSLKFVGLFVCEYDRTIRNFDKRQIASIVYHRVEWLEYAVRKMPDKFTATFLKVFEAYQSYVRDPNSQGRSSEGL